MEIGIFQLLPRGCAPSDREVVEQALWEVDFAECNGFDSVWITEHHFSGFGSIGVPSVYAAGIAQRTTRIRIGYGVAVLPLHHPLQLAEEIAWVDHLSSGRVAVGAGPGFSPFEFSAFNVSVENRHALFLEKFEIVRRALAEAEITFEGRRYAIRPRPYTQPHPPFYWASTSDESLRKAGEEGMPVLFGLESASEIGERLARYRAIRLETGATNAAIDREIAEMYVLRRIYLSDTDDKALADVQGPLAWHREMAVRVHQHEEPCITLPIVFAPEHSETTPGDGEPVSSPADGKPIEIGESEFVGSPATIIQRLRELQALGLRKIIGWFHFGNMPHQAIRRSMQHMANEVMPRLR